MEAAIMEAAIIVIVIGLAFAFGILLAIVLGPEED